ncbi:MAG: hypothetical protein H0U98_18655 [Alphaproteobacteria bacterium]|nr:hypothetical protein [Alphaproteobacteria bacterium]
MSAHVLLVTTTSWPFPAQLAAAFAGTGAQVEALCPPSAMLALSCHPVRLHRYNPMTAMDSLARATAAARPDMIIPCDDQAAKMVTRTRGRTAIGRMEFLDAAAGCGAPVPASLALENEGQLEDAMHRLGLPLVIKSDHSWGGEGVVIAVTRDEARTAFHRMSNPSRLRDMARALRGRGTHFLTRALAPAGARISAQAFVEGVPATSSIACWQGEVVGAHHFDVVLSSTPTSPASVIAAVPCPQMAASAKAVVRALNLSGLIGLDYIRDTRGQVHLLEMNARATPTAHLALDEDLPASLLKAAGLPARTRPPVTDASEIALFPREWLRDPASPWLARAFHDVPWDDPKVVRACVRNAPAAAQAMLESTQEPALTSKSPVFGT